MTTVPPTPAGTADPRLDAALAAIRLAMPVLERIVSHEDERDLIGNPYHARQRQFDLRGVLVPAREAFDAARAVLSQTQTAR